MIETPPSYSKLISFIRIGLFAVLFVTAIAFFAAPGSADPSIIEYLTASPRYISPNDDGVQDVMTFLYRLNDSATVYLLVVRKDSSTVVDTLVSGLPQEPDRQHTAVWDGMFFDGTPAPEDTFLAVIRAQNDEETDSLYSQNVFIDVTDPTVVITAIFPGQFAPESKDPGRPKELDIDYIITDPPPSDSVETIVRIIDPTKEEVETFPGRFLAANDTSKTIWDGLSAKEDGLYRIEVWATDRAGNESTVFDFVDVDTDGPVIAITNVENGAKLSVLPDSISGWAFDRHGVRDSVWVRYDTDLPLRHISTFYYREDTLFFDAVLADSIPEEGVYAMGFKAADLLGVERTLGFTITWDTSPPSPPVLKNPPPVSYSPNFLLDGEVDGAVDDVMRIYRNDALADTIFPNVTGNWPHPMTLEVGLNRIWAVIVDNATNVSDPSNTIEVTYDNSSGLFIPQPFRPGDAFQVNLSKSTAAVTLRVYDLGGHLVVTLYNTESAVKITIPWDGLNGDGDKVMKGPLVAVAHVKSAGEAAIVFREIFVFEP